MKEKELSLSGMSHKGIHDRGYLPHWDFGNSVQAITFRLADSLPQKILKGWREELRVALGSPDSETSRMAQADLYRRISRYEDAGHGACLLNNPDHAEAVQDLLIKGHGSAYRLIEWCIMPNHVHVLVRLLGDTPLGSVIKKWKGASAILINRLEERGGSVWMADYHDRLVRNMDHFHDVRAYIRRNPVKAGLCEEPEEWRFSSAGAKWNGELAREETGTRGIDSALPVSGSALSGHLDLRCELRPDGVPFVSRQSFRAPIHLSKSHLDQGHLVQSIVNPTAGFFDGDELRMNVEVEAGARLVLSTPSASRVYRTRSGEAATNKQNFTVGENAMLEWIPEPFIPHAGARYVQRTLLDLHPSASLLFFDWIAPGRVAMGEVFAYRQLRWELDLRVGDKLVARERYDLKPGDDSLEALRAKFPAAHYLSVYAKGPIAGNWPADALDALNDGNVYIGHGPLPEGVFVIRALCRDSLSARGLLEKLRPLLYQAAGMKSPTLGRIFC